jgi:hypothetical protein
LLQFIEAHEVRAAKREEARLKKQADSYQEIDWDDEKEKSTTGWSRRLLV